MPIGHSPGKGDLFIPFPHCRRILIMAMLRIRNAVPLEGHCLRLTLTDGSTVERDLSSLLVGPVFEAVRNDPEVFKGVTVRHGTVSGPGNVDLCPDVVLGLAPPSAVVNQNADTNSG